MPQFHSTERLGAVQSTTREGFLLCEGVPVSRTGVLLYAPGELPIPPGPDGLIRVHRSEDDVFAPTAIASFEGKSIVDLHPGVDVTPQNWRQFAVGHMQNVRRGTNDGKNDQTQLLLADLVIKDQAAIDAVRSGKRHVSLGYDASYSVFATGNANQTNIIGNHVALVPQGRCGPTCSIGDADMTTAITTRTWMDRIRSAFTAQDETMLAAALAEAPVAGSAAAVPVIHVHTGDREGSKDPQREFASATADALTALSASVKELATKFGDLDGKVTGIVVKQTADAEAKAAAEAKATADAEAAAAAEKAAKVAEDAAKVAREASAKTGDSAALQGVWQDVMARAEILLPGVSLPTFDAAAAPQTTEDALCGFRRKVLVSAVTSGTGREHVNAMVPAGADISQMTCDAVGMTFQAASELAKVTNNGASGKRIGTVGLTTNVVKPKSPAEINALNAAYWSKKN